MKHQLDFEKPIFELQAKLDDLKNHPEKHSLDVSFEDECRQIEKKIEAAFKRSAEVDARRISVVAEDGRVTLSGNVHSWMERQEAERAAWAAPGVRHVDDRLTVVP